MTWHTCHPYGVGDCYRCEEIAGYGDPEPGSYAYTMAEVADLVRRDEHTARLGEDTDPDGY